MSARYRVVWTESAASDYEAVLGYVSANSGLLNAQRLDKKLERSMALLDTSPTRCRVVPELRAEGVDAYREFIVRPYRIMLRIRYETLVVLAVVDGRRDLSELLLERALLD